MSNPSSTIALALAGGGPMGGIYELGALIALQQAIPSLQVNQLPMYVGVSAGSVIASALANRFSIHEIASNLIRPEVAEHPIHPSLFYSPAWSEYLRRIAKFPQLTLRAIYNHINDPKDESLLESLTQLKSLLPSGFFDNRPIERYLNRLFNEFGVSNRFTELDTTLLIIASDLDCGRSIVFGQGDWKDVDISKAVQASTTVPGLYVPVNIHNRYFVDGILYKTVHASAAFDAGADLVLCINPIVPYRNQHFDTRDPEHTSIIQEGTSGIISQAIRAMVHSRSTTGFRQYERDYPDKTIILFEPEQEDAQWFFANEFSFSNRVHLVDQAYRSTLRDLQRRYQELQPKLEKHGLAIDKAKLYPMSSMINKAKAQTPSRRSTLQPLRDTLDKLQQNLETEDDIG